MCIYIYWHNIPRGGTTIEIYTTFRKSVESHMETFNKRIDTMVILFFEGF